MGLLKSHKKNTKTKLSIILTTAVLFFSLVIVQPVGAVTKIVNMSPQNAATAFVLYKALRTCLTEGRLKNDSSGVITNTISSADAQAYKWFHAGRTDIGVYGDQRAGGDGQWACYTDQGVDLAKRIVSVTGYDSPAAFLCAIGFTREVNRDNCSAVSSGENDFKIEGDKGGKLDKWWSETMGANGNYGPNGVRAGAYWLYYKSFTEACGVVETTTGTADYTIMAPAGDGKTLVERKYAINDRDKNSGTSLRLYSGTKITCGELANLLKNGTPAVNAMKAWLSNPQNSDGLGVEDTDEETATSCVVEGTGRIICSIAKTLAQMTDGIFGLLTEFLAVQPLNINTAANDNFLYRVWSIMRTIANVLFVIAFLIIIFSQLTSVGVSNYGVKKLLPRLIVSAILVNTSFWVMAILIDASNLAGAGLYNLIHTISNNLGGIAVQTNLWEDILTTLLAGGTLAFTAGAGISVAVAGTGGAVASAALWTVLPVLLTVLLAIIIAFAVLAARQALIVILVVLSPLAFVAYLLPNTENLFKLWKGSLQTMLVFYPIFAIIFAGSQLAGYIIIAAIPEDSTFKMPMIILGLFVMVAPLILTPLMAKYSGGLIGQLAGKMNNVNKGWIDRSKKVGQRKRGIAVGETMNKQMGGNRFTRGVAGLYRKGYRGVKNSAQLDSERQKAIDAQNQAAYDQTRQQLPDDKNGNPVYSKSQQAFNAQQAAKMASQSSDNKARSNFLGTAEAVELTGDVAISKVEVDKLETAHDVAGLKAVNNSAASRDLLNQDAVLKSQKEMLENQREARTEDHLRTSVTAQQFNKQAELAKKATKTFEDERQLKTEADLEHNEYYQQLQERHVTAKTGKDMVENEGEARTMRALENNADYQEYQYRNRAAGADKDLQQSKEKAAFRESVSTSKPIDASNPLAANIQAARDVELQTNVTRDRTASAEGILQQDYSRALTDNTPVTVDGKATTVGAALADQAGGIDTRGPQRVVSRAEQVVDEVRRKAVAAEFESLKLHGARPAEIVEQLKSGLNTKNETANQDEIESMIQYVAKVGTTEDVIAMTDAMSGPRYSTTDAVLSPETIQANRQIQQTFGEAARSSGAMSISGKAFGDLSVGDQITDYNTQMVETIRAKKFKGESFAKMDIDEMKHLQKLVKKGKLQERLAVNPDGTPAADGGRDAKVALYQAIERRLTDPILSAGLSERDRDVYTDIQKGLGLNPGDIGSSGPKGGGSGPGGIAMPGDPGFGDLRVPHDE